MRRRNATTRAGEDEAVRGDDMRREERDKIKMIARLATGGNGLERFDLQAGDNDKDKCSTPLGASRRRHARMHYPCL